MSNSKHAHYRYNILDKCFRRRARPMAFQEILDAVIESIAELYPREGISIRTLRDDIRLFRDSEKGFGAPVVVERYQGKDIYIYSDPEFSIAKNIDNSFRNNILEFLKNKSFVFILMLLFLNTFRL